MNPLMPFFSPPAWPELAAELQGKPWQTQQKLMIELAKALPAWPDDWQSEDYRIAGCEVPVYLVRQPRLGVTPWAAWSPSKVVCGQLRLLQSYDHFLSPRQHTADDLLAAFEIVGMSRRLPDSRRHGLQSVLSSVLADEG